MDDPVDGRPPEPLDPAALALLLTQRSVWKSMMEGMRHPWMTRALLGMVVLAHVSVGAVMWARGSIGLVGIPIAQRGARLLVRCGAMHGPSLDDGELWRLISPLFLHGDGVHILLNGVALYGLGRLCEAVYGPVRFLWLFLFTGAVGATASWLGGNTTSVGASGAIFGFMGACIVFGWRYRAELPAPIGELFRRKLLPWVGLNLFIGMVVPFIDNLGHVGGLIAGAFFALVMRNQVIPGADSPRWMHGLTATICVLSITWACLGVWGEWY